MQRKMPCRGHGQSAPPGCQRTGELAMREERDIASLRAKVCNQPVGAVRHVHDRLAAWTSILKDLPVRLRSLDVHRSPAFVDAVVPLA